MALRFCDGFETGIAITLYNADLDANGWQFNYGPAGPPDAASTSSLRWTHTSGYGGGSYALALPYNARARTMAMPARGVFTLESFVIAFCFAMDADAAGITDNQDLVRALDTSGTEYIRVRTNGSSDPVALDIEVYDGASWQNVGSSTAQFEVGKKYWLALEVQRAALAPFIATAKLYVGTETTDPVETITGTPQNLNSARELGFVQWRGIVSTTGGGNGDTIIDSTFVWDDPTADATNATQRRWWIDGFEAEATQATDGPGTWSAQGGAASIDAAVRTKTGSEWAQIQSGAPHGAQINTQALQIANVSTGLATILGTVLCVSGKGIVSQCSGQTLKPLAWRGGAYEPVGPTVSDGSTNSRYITALYELDPTSTVWTRSTFDDASGILYASTSTSVTARFERFIIELAWNDFNAPGGRVRPTFPEPKTFLLPHDRKMVRSNTSLNHEDGVTTPSQLGPYIGTTFPASTNSGNVMPFHNADSWETGATTKHPVPTGFTYRLQVAGGVLSAAEFAWKFLEDDEAQYRGEIDIRHECDHHNPWSNDKQAHALIAVYSKAFNRLICGRYEGFASINYWWELKYKSISKSDRRSWDGSFFYPSAAGLAAFGYAPERLPDTANCSWAIAWETPDGALRVGYVYKASFSSTADLDIWGSVDGGETWQILRERVLSETFGRNVLPSYVTCDTSGDWVRIMIFDTASTPNAGLCTIASSDRGASWKIVNASADGFDVFPGNYINSVLGGASRATSDIVGVDSVDGAFIRARSYWDGVNPLTKELYIDYAAGTDDFVNIWGSLVTHQWDSRNLQRVHAFRTSNHLALLFEYTDGTRDDFKLTGLLIPRDKVLSGLWTDATDQPITDEWTMFSYQFNRGAMGLDDNVYTAPMRNRMVWAGDSIAHVAGLYSQGRSAGSLAEDFTYVSYLGGWDRRALHISEPDDIGIRGGFFEKKFSSQFGNIQDYNTPSWLEASAGTPILTWDPFALHLRTPVSSSIYWISSTLTTAVTEHLADESIIVWTMNSGVTTALTAPTSSADYDKPKLGMYTTATASAGTTVHIGVHYTTTGIHIYDQFAGTTIYTDSTTDFEQEREYRLSLAFGQRIGLGGVNYYAEFAHKARGVDEAWVASGLLTLTNGHIAGHISEVIHWGHIQAPTGTTTFSNWSDVAFQRDWLSNRPGFVNPRDLRGAQLSPFARHSAQGIHVAWGGGGGFVGDYWSSRVKYEYGVDQLASPSPSMFWQTDGAVTTSIIFDASTNDPSSATHASAFLHNATAIVGSNFRKCVVEYAATTSFASPVSALLTLDAAVFTLRVTSASTNSVTVDRATAAGDLLRSNICAGWYAEISYPTAGATLDGEVLKIHSTWDDKITFEQPHESLNLLAGATLTFFPSTMLLPFENIDSSYASGVEARFMRLKLDPSVAKPRSGDAGFRVGRVVAGMTLPIDVPLDWKYRDEQESNVDLFTADSGTRSAYRQGKERRVIRADSIGDVDRWRESFRGTIRKVAEYEANPMVLVMDSLSPNDSMLYSRLVSSTELENDGWRYDGDNTRWYSVGDVSAIWEEEV